MDIKEHQQVWSISFFNTKIGSGISVHEQLTEELHNMQLKNSKGENSMRDLKAIFRQ